MILIARPVLLAIVLASSCMAQTLGAVPDSSSTLAISSVTLQSSPDSAHVMVDGRRVGITPISLDSVSPGLHVVTLQHDDVGSWLAEPVSDTVWLEAGERKILRYDLKTRYIITSSPFGADVVIGDSIIGTTPLATTADIFRQPVALKKQGYEPATVQFSGGITTFVPLKKIWLGDEHDDTFLGGSSSRGSKPIEVYISGAATILSGVAAAYFKVKADDRYEQYLLTGDSRLLSQTHRLDTAAGVAIAATQIGLGLFTYFILSQ